MEAANKPTLSIDGSRFDTLEEFYDEVSERLIPGADWGRNLAAFNDILRGGFGTPEEGFVLLWSNHRLSRERLGYDATVRQLRLGLERCHESYLQHPPNISYFQSEIEAAKRGEGNTIFDEIVEIIQAHCPGGEEGMDNIELVLA